MSQNTPIKGTVVNGKESSDTYILGRSAAETRRLIRQAQIYGPLTRQFFIAAGITTGVKVLDVGSGAGDVALLLADLVGPRGAVVGVEMNPAILDTARTRVQALGWTNVTFLAGDVHSIALDNDFDAVAGRWILMHLSDPVAVLHQLLRHLKPGGLIAFQEGDFTYPPTALPPAHLHQQVMRQKEVFPELTDREREILHLIATGAANSEIAQHLSLSTKTVSNYVSNIFNKLQVADRAEAIIRPRDAGLGQS